jgi:predicted NBD/HSP70 family sugar kinase
MSSLNNKQLVTILGVGLSVGLGILIASRLNKNKKKDLSKPTNVLSLEMGGTGCKISLLTRRWNYVHKKYDYTIESRHETESTSPTETVDRLLDFVKGSEFSQIGIASFGPVCLKKNDPAYGSITSTPKLQWQHFSLLDYIRKKTSCQDVFIDTDVNAAALAEYRLGTGLSLLNS